MKCTVYPSAYLFGTVKIEKQDTSLISFNILFNNLIYFDIQQLYSIFLKH